jgi:hypothetical protein
MQQWSPSPRAGAISHEHRAIVFLEGVTRRPSCTGFQKSQLLSNSRGRVSSHSWGAQLVPQSAVWYLRSAVRRTASPSIPLFPLPLLMFRVFIADDEDAVLAPHGLYCHTDIKSAKEISDFDPDPGPGPWTDCHRCRTGVGEGGRGAAQF